MDIDAIAAEGDSPAFALDNTAKFRKHFSRIGFLASYGGSSMQAIIKACNSGRIAADPVVVVSNNRSAVALDRARGHGLTALHISHRTEGTQESADQAICRTFLEHGVDLVVLSGYMRPAGVSLLESYSGRMFNIHPALLPKYGGKGMYGMFVHEAVIAAGEQESGATIHQVTEEYDTGAIIAQFRIPVLSDDTPKTLAQRIREKEPHFFVEVLRRVWQQP